MTDQQQIEIWRKEFIEKHDLGFNLEIDKQYGRFYCDNAESAFDGFCMAKRNLPVIELPKSYHIVFYSRSQESGFDDAIECVAEILQELGYQYRIKGE